MSKIIYDEIDFYKLIYVFEQYENFIKRKNASKEKNLVEYRTQKIIETYNNIVDYTKDVFESDDTDLKTKIRKKRINLRDRVIECLAILGVNATVPTDLKARINYNESKDESNGTHKTNHNTKKKNENSDNNNKNNFENPNKEPNKMTLTKIEYHNLCARTLTMIFSGDPLALTPFLKSISYLEALDETKEHVNLLRDYVMTKLQGVAIECLPENPTLENIKETLKDKIKPENSKIVHPRE